MRLDPKFALAWALLSYVDSRGYLTQSLQPTVALREEARQAAETALTLQPNLGEAVLAKGSYHYACLKDYDTAVRYFEQARQLLPNSSRIPESLAYVARRRGQWDRSEVVLQRSRAARPAQCSPTHPARDFLYRIFVVSPKRCESLIRFSILRRTTSIPSRQRRLSHKREGDLPRASALLAPLHSAADDTEALETQVYQAILERRPAQIIPRLKEILAKPDPALGYHQWRTALLVRLGAGSRRRPCRRPGKLATGAQRTGTFPQRTAGKLYPHWRSRADQYGSR